MARIKKSITIDAPVEKVFEYLSIPENMMEWWPNVIAIRDVAGSGEGQSWSFDYKMIGLRFTSKARVTASSVNADRFVESKGGISAKWRWYFRSVGTRTHLRWVMDYTIPVPVLGKVGEALILRRNERVARFAMVNIKERMEN